MPLPCLQHYLEGPPVVVPDKPLHLGLINFTTGGGDFELCSSDAFGAGEGSGEETVCVG